MLEGGTCKSIYIKWQNYWGIIALTYRFAVPYGVVEGKGRGWIKCGARGNEDEKIEKLGCDGGYNNGTITIVLKQNIEQINNLKLSINGQEDSNYKCNYQSTITMIKV